MVIAISACNLICEEKNFDDLSPHAYLEECLGERGDDVIVALNQGKTVGTHGFPFLPLLHLGS